MSQSTHFKQTELGEIPEEWEVRELKEILSLSQSGIWGSEPDWSEDVFPVIRSTEIDQEGNLHLDSPTLAWRKVPKHRAVNYALRDGDILVVKSSGSRHLLGRVAYFKQQGEKVFLFSNFLHRLRANERVCTSLFLYYVLTSPIAKRTLEALQETTSGLRNLPIDEYLQMLIPLPPLEEQKRIAGVLRLVDEIIERTRQIVSLYEKAKKYALSHLLTKGIGHTRFKQTELGEIPEEWEVIKIGDIAVLEMQQILASNLPSETLYIGMEHIESGTGRLVTNCLPTVTSVKGNVFCFNPTHILYGKLRPYLNKVFLPDFCGCCSTELVPVKPNPNKVLRSFLFYQMLSPRFVLYAQQFSEGTRMPRVNLQKFLEFLIPLPPLEEQKRIAEILSTIDKAIDNERRYLEALGKLKKWLLNNLLTGKVRLPEWVGDTLKQVFPEG